MVHNVPIDDSEFGDDDMEVEEQTNQDDFTFRAVGVGLVVG